MRRSTVIAIRKEIGRSNLLVGRWKRAIKQKRAYCVSFPGDPAEEFRLIEEMLETQKKWQTAVKRRVLQLAGLDSGVGIDTTWEGRMDLELPSA